MGTYHSVYTGDDEEVAQPAVYQTCAQLRRLPRGLTRIHAGYPQVTDLNFQATVFIVFRFYANIQLFVQVKVKVKQSRYRPGVAQRVSRKLSFPDFMTTAQDGGKVVGLTHRPPLPPRKCSWYSFLLEAE